MESLFTYSNIKELLNNYNKAMEDCIHHNFLIEPLNSKLSKEFFVLFRNIYDNIESTELKEPNNLTESEKLKNLFKSVVFLRTIESFANLTKKIIFSTTTLDQSALDKYKNTIIDFYQIVNYPIDLENFVYDF